ncbi:hypothetical protein EDB89DRAFT_2234212 [Lactarius sanguifluus]|nr:hypothetical protein EDB89DRAFT_2234212 [Lactarius sanguifluus]
MGIFDLGPASRDLLPFRIRLLTRSHLAIDHRSPLALLALPSLVSYTIADLRLTPPWTPTPTTSQMTLGTRRQAARPGASFHLCPLIPRLRHIMSPFSLFHRIARTAVDHHGPLGCL